MAASCDGERSYRSAARREADDQRQPTPYLFITYKNGSVLDCFPVSASGSDVRLTARGGSAPDRPLEWARVARIEFDLGATTETVDLDPAAVEALGLGQHEWAPRHGVANAAGEAPSTWPAYARNGMAASRTRCVHCLRPLSHKTKDHAPPKTWYPNNTGKNRPTAPACSGCNAALGELEKSIMLRIAPALDPDAPAVGDVVARAWRAMSPSAGKSEADVRARTVERDRFRAMVHYASTSPPPQVMPNFGPDPDGDNFPTVIATVELVMIAEKMVRVLLHRYQRRYVERDDVVRVALGIGHEAMRLIPSRLPPGAGWLAVEHAPGTFSVSFRMHEPEVLGWAFRFWDRLNILACSGPASRVRELCPEWGESGGIRRLRLEVPDSAYQAVGATPPRRK